MRIAPLIATKINFSANRLNKKENQPKNSASGNENKRKNTASAKESDAIKANARVKINPQLQIKKLAVEVEDSINSGLEDKILEYHKFIRNLIKKNIAKKEGVAFDSKGVRYEWLHNFASIQIKQTYEGKCVNDHYYFYGYENGKLPDGNRQTAFAHTFLNTNDNTIDYRFGDYNLDDEHGWTDALIKDEDKFIYIDTGYDAFSPTKTKYRYKDGKLISAEINTYGPTDIKHSKFFFDENRKVETVHYDIKHDYSNNKQIPKQVFKRNEKGDFVLVAKDFD